MSKINRGVFYCITKDGEATDEGITNEMLENEKEIRGDLIRMEIIKEFTGRLIKPRKVSSKTKRGGKAL